MTRGIQQQTTVNVVAGKTPQVQLNSKDPQFDSSLARFQQGVTQTLDGVLDWLNSHFKPATPTQVSRNQLMPDDETLYDANDVKIRSSYPLLYTFPTSTLVAGSTQTILTMTLPPDAQLFSLYLNAPIPTAGSAKLNNATIGGASSYTFEYPLTGPIISLAAVSTSNFAIPAGQVSVVAYVGEVQQ